MAYALNAVDRGDLRLGEGDLPAVKGEKFIIGKLRVVRNENVVVGISDDGISRVLIDFFDLLGCQTTVRKHGMTVKICLVKITRFGQKMLFH
jgi:hypothetical protein